MSQPILPHTQNYFHGKITREQAEKLLLDHGGHDGAFLLRESVNNSYTISICHNKRLHHYNIEHQLDGTYQIPTGRKFIGPIELVRHHSQYLDGFLTLARHAVDRESIMSFYVFQGVTSADLEENLLSKSIQLGLKGSGNNGDVISGPMREHLIQLVLQDLHKCQPWFHEGIRRCDAESRLEEAGHLDGHFLVRFRMEDNSYALSLSFQGLPKHYKINYQLNKLQIEGGQFFDTLIEMIDHYHFRQDGLLCKLRYPVDSPRYQRSRSEANSNTSLSLSGSSTPNSLPLTTEKSPSPQIQSTTHQVTVKQDPNPIQSFSSCSSSGSNSTDSHKSTSSWGMAESDSKSPTNVTPFPNRTNMFMNPNANVSSINPVVTPLRAINSSNNLVTTPASILSGTAFNPSCNQIGKISSNSSVVFSHNSSFGLCDVRECQNSHPPHYPNSIAVSTPTSFISQNKNHNTGGGLNQPYILDEAWEEPELDCALYDSGMVQSDISAVNVCQIPQNTHSDNLPFLNDLFSDYTQSMYDALPFDDGTFNLDPSQISIKDKLGGGNFGYVFGGIYNPPNGDKEMPVAIKMLKQDQVTNVNKDDIMTEARIMAQLKHRHIVRLIGVCKDVEVMLILEIAPLGPINKYLRNNLDVDRISITELVYQVTLGMAYLETSKFVHRDLAARNVLLVNEKYAKISDFGMSKALKFGNDYYRAAIAGKWPIKWYAPECIYYFKFDSKSDVWSYGVTLWEVFSYGSRPYRDMKGAQILSMIDRGKRLEKPLTCPDCMYDVMIKCWEFDGARRPTFAELVMMISRILNNFHMETFGTR